MKKVITYGTYDLLHEGHINLLKRAKALGDYLIVGVTTDNFDIDRGKLNVRNNVLERVESVRQTGLADQIIIEEYVGQKIDDIQKYNIDIFVIGSDWKGKFDYLKEYCEVIYLPRTEGISSTQLRNQTKKTIKLGIIGTGRIANRFIPEATVVDSVYINAVFNTMEGEAKNFAEKYQIPHATSNFKHFIEQIDAAYIASPHLTHYKYAKQLLLNNKHVLCEVPFVLKKEEAIELYEISKEKKLVLQEAHKTAFCPAFNHIITLVKSGIIGDIVDVEASLSTLVKGKCRELDKEQAGGSMTENGCFTILPILKIFGTQYKDLKFYSRFSNGVDIYTHGIVQYNNAIASFKVGLGVKTEGNLVISGTEGYVYVPAPWWKTDYFEVRYEDINKNKKYFYSFEKDGLRYEIQEFISCIINNRITSYKLTQKESIGIAHIIEKFLTKNECNLI